ncbi:MAG: DHHA1 domain-containing protein [archaeon]
MSTKTGKIYLADPFLKEFSTRITGIKILAGKTFAILDRTAFHPQGGGQPGDRGAIGTARVLDTIEKDGEILHQIDSPLSPGDCNCKIEWGFRFPLMQLHTGEHLFFSRLEIVCPEVRIDKVDFSPERGKLFLSGELEPRQLLEAEELTNSAIRRAIPVKSRIFSTLAEAKSALPDSRLKEERLPEKDIRIVEIEGEDFAACSGTHLQNTSEIGHFKILSINKSGKSTIVEFAAGERAVSESGSLANRALELALALQVEPEKLVPTAVNQKKELLHLRETSRRQSALIAKSENPVPEKFGEISFYSKNYCGILDRRDLAELAERLVSQACAVALIFGGIEQDFFTVVLAKSPECALDLPKLSEKLFPLVSGRGGGKPTLITGSGRNPEGIPAAISAARESLK